MFSLSKIMALVAILAAVWYGFKLVGRLDEARKRKAADATARNQPARNAPQRSEEAADGVLDLVKDESGNYVAKDNRNDRV